MRIGIDAKWFYEGPPSGKVVVRNLIEHFIQLNTKNQIYLFLNKKHKNEEFPFINASVNIVYVWSGINLLSNVFILKYKAEKLKLDIVLFQNFPSYSKKFESIAFIHDALYLSYPQYYTFKERAYFYPLKYLARKSSLIITISEAEKKRLLKQGFSLSDNIKVAYHGINKAFKPKEDFKRAALESTKIEHKLPNEFLLYVGRLNVRKNIKNLLIAFEKIENKEIPLVIVGKMDHKMFDINSFIKQLKLEKRVIILNYVSNKHLPAIYAMATVFCFPSFAEGFGLPILEAMAARIPVLTSNTSSMPEIAGNSAHLVSPENISEIVEGINLLLSDKKYSNELSIKGYNRSLDFSWDKSAKRILNIIEENSK